MHHTPAHYERQLAHIREALALCDRVATESELLTAAALLAQPELSARQPEDKP